MFEHFENKFYFKYFIRSFSHHKSIHNCLPLHFKNLVLALLINTVLLTFWRVTVTVTKLWHEVSCPKRYDFAVFKILSDSGPMQQTKPI